jgi:cell division protein FtsI (penicillin-binding protein 3)
LPAKVLSAFQANGGTSSTMPDSGSASAQLPAPKIVPAVQVKDKGSVVVDAGLRVAVPSFEGVGLRSAVEKADAVGLRVQPVGSGLAREQVPAAGTMVPAGTEVVVRFSR